MRQLLAISLCLSLVLTPAVILAAPQGGRVVGGSATISAEGAATTIRQTSDRAIINWNSFDIGRAESVTHTMPSPGSAGLHRVVGGGGPSQIQGKLESNGSIYLVNPAGVVLHKGAQVNVGGFTATTRDIADENFMKGNMVFDRPGQAGAAIVNKGSITVRESGLAALVAPTVRNEGVIAARLGKVALASGDAAWKLDLHGDDLVTFTVSDSDARTLHAADGTPLSGGVENSGSIRAEGGVVVLTASQLDGIVSSVVNSGEVSTASADGRGGGITFKGRGSAVAVRNAGSADASSKKGDGGSVRMTGDAAVVSSGRISATGGRKGGRAVVTGGEVALKSGSVTDASGAAGGGTVLVGGNAQGRGPERSARTAKVENGAVVRADAKADGDGGQVVVWSDGRTDFAGTISARGAGDGRGGMVETSGRKLGIDAAARVDTSAPSGRRGRWLLDPEDFVIAASGGDMTGAALSAGLEVNDVTILGMSGRASSTGAGRDIIIRDPVSWSSGSLLTLDAGRNVVVGADITATGNGGGLNIMTGSGGAFELANGARVTLSGSSPRLAIDGQEYGSSRPCRNCRTWRRIWRDITLLARTLTLLRQERGMMDVVLFPSVRLEMFMVFLGC